MLGSHGPTSTFKIVTVWLVLATVLFVGLQAWLAHEERTLVTVSADEITLERGRDGHYHWPGRVGNVPVVFLVDTGATRTAIPEALAQRAGLPKGSSFRSSTAGGEVLATNSVADIELQGGFRAQRLRVGVMPDLQTPLLGMDILGKLSIAQQDNRMRIRAAAAR